MKRILLFMVLATCLSQMAFAAGSEPGNWKWKRNDGANATTANNMGIVLSHEHDVIRLRMQFYSGTLSTTQANGHIFLQYCDAGPTVIPPSTHLDARNWALMPLGPSPSGQFPDSTHLIYPLLNSETMGDATSTVTMPFNRFSAGPDAALFSANASGTNKAFGPATGLQWYTIADSGIVHNTDPSHALDSLGSAFVMTNPDNNVIPHDNDEYPVPSGVRTPTSDILDTLHTGTTKNPNGILELGAPDRRYRAFSLNSIVEQSFTSRNGNTTGQSLSSNNHYVAEFEFRFKAAYDNVNKKGNLQPGHRYFFRIRSWGTNSSGTGFSSPYGGNSSHADNYGAWNSTTTTDMANASIDDEGGTGYRYGGYGDYSARAPMPYLDVDANFYAKTVPVRYSKELTATVINNNVGLTWTTAQEINNRHFELQRSTDGVHFKTIGTIATKAANGNCTTPLSYSHTDASPANGVNYYRLNQVNHDGTSETGRVASIRISGGINAANASVLYPNPASSYVNISNIQAGSFYKIINSGGQVVGSGIATSTLQNISVSNLPSGVYFVQFSSQLEGTKTLKFLKK